MATVIEIDTIDEFRAYLEQDGHLGDLCAPVAVGASDMTGEGAPPETFAPGPHGQHAGVFFRGRRSMRLAKALAYRLARRQAGPGHSDLQIREAVEQAFADAQAGDGDSERPFLDWLFKEGGLERIIEAVLKILAAFG